jgi:hypothetical protein
MMKLLDLEFAMSIRRAEGAANFGAIDERKIAS